MKSKDDDESQPRQHRVVQQGLSHSAAAPKSSTACRPVSIALPPSPASTRPLAPTATCGLSIFADDHPLLETEVAGDQPPQPIDVQIAGAKRLKIVVDYGQNLDTGDWLNLCDAKIVK